MSLLFWKLKSTHNSRRFFRYTQSNNYQEAVKMKILSYRHQTRGSERQMREIRWDTPEEIKLWKMDSHEMIDTRCNNEKLISCCLREFEGT